MILNLLEGSMKFKVDIIWSGYCRGVSGYLVEAENEEEAVENWYDGEELYHETHRDDTEKEIYKVEEVNETN